MSFTIDPIGQEPGEHRSHTRPAHATVTEQERKPLKLSGQLSSDSALARAATGRGPAHAQSVQAQHWEPHQPPLQANMRGLPPACEPQPSHPLAQFQHRTRYSRPSCQNACPQRKPTHPPSNKPLTNNNKKKKRTYRLSHLSMPVARPINRSHRTHIKRSKRNRTEAACVHHATGVSTPTADRRPRPTEPTRSGRGNPAGAGCTPAAPPLRTAHQTLSGATCGERTVLEAALLADRASPSLPTGLPLPRAQ